MWALSNLQLDLTVQGIEKAGPPQIVDNLVIFTYQSKNPIRFVGARFENENYKTLHIYEINKNHIFVLIYPIPQGVTRLRYRITVDGLWISDPFNPDKEYDETGTVFSIVKLPPSKEITPQSEPYVLGEGKVRFTLKTHPGKNIYLMGDFNNWDPFMTRMQETEEGIYTVTIHVLPGRHYYYFIVDGKKLLDPNNTDIRTDYEGFAVSSFYMPDYTSRK